MLRTLKHYAGDNWPEMILLLCVLISLCVWCSGCIGGGRLFSPPPPATPGIGPGGIVPPYGAAGHNDIPAVVQKQVWLFWIAGFLCLLVAGAAGYFSQYMVALKFGLAGLILPIVGTWWSQHYAIVIAGVLIGLAIWYFLTHQAARSAVAAEIENLQSTLKKTL